MMWMLVTTLIAGILGILWGWQLFVITILIGWVLKIMNNSLKEEN